MRSSGPRSVRRSDEIAAHGRTADEVAADRAAELEDEGRDGGDAAGLLRLDAELDEETPEQADARRAEEALRGAETYSAAGLRDCLPTLRLADPFIGALVSSAGFRMVADRKFGELDADGSGARRALGRRTRGRARG